MGVNSYNLLCRNHPVCITQLLTVMATIVMEKTERVLVSLQQIRELPRMLAEAAPSMPGTLRDAEVPHYFRENYVRTGYRPLNQSWRYYFLSLFQRHNETINVWTHLLPFLFFLVKLWQLAEALDFVNDPHLWPLLVHIMSSLTYMGLSSTAHLLGGKSELCHFTFFFLDYVGVAQYQYGSAIVYFYYAVDESMHKHVHGIFMPTAAVLSCLTCLGCCYGKYCNHSLPSWVLKVCQMVPSVLACIWDSSPIVNRIMSWSTASNDPVVIFYIGQVVILLSCAFFFTFPVTEHCFPGQCDFVGQSHQLFHVLISFGTLSQIHTALLDFAGRRKLYSRLHHSNDAALFVGLYIFTLVVCALISAIMLTKTKQLLDIKVKSS